MTESNDKSARATELEKQKQLALEAFLKNAVAFFAADVKIVESLSSFMETFVAEAKKNPAALFANENSDLEALFTKFKAKSEGGDAGIAGHDIVGEAPTWLADLTDFIKSCGDFLNGEKKVFLAILLLIFCPGIACGCICEFIKS